MDVLGMFGARSRDDFVHRYFTGHYARRARACGGKKNNLHCLGWSYSSLTKEDEHGPHAKVAT